MFIRWGFFFFSSTLCECRKKRFPAPSVGKEVEGISILFLLRVTESRMTQTLQKSRTTGKSKKTRQEICHNEVVQSKVNRIGLNTGLSYNCGFWHLAKSIIALDDSRSMERIAHLKHSYWASRACLGVPHWVSARCLSKDWVLPRLIKTRYWEISFQRETLLYSASAARNGNVPEGTGLRTLFQHQTKWDQSHFPFVLDLKTTVLICSSAHTSVPCLGCLDREKPLVEQSQGDVLFEDSVLEMLGVWLIFLTGSWKCLGEHFSVSSVFCCFCDIFSASFHSPTKVPRRNACQTTFTDWCRFSKTHFFFQQETARDSLSNANTEIVFHSRLAEMVKDVDKAEYLLLIALFQVAIQLLK